MSKSKNTRYLRELSNDWNRFRFDVEKLMNRISSVIEFHKKNNKIDSVRDAQIMRRELVMKICLSLFLSKNLVSLKRMTAEYLELSTNLICELDDEVQKESSLIQCFSAGFNEGDIFNKVKLDENEYINICNNEKALNGINESLVELLTDVLDAEEKYGVKF